MAVTTPLPSAKIIPIPGDAITVQLQLLPGVENQVALHIERNGAAAKQFTITELQDVLRHATMMLSAARANLLNVPPQPRTPS